MAVEQASLLDALDPDFSVVVEACAGSGKTWLLVSRIVRLLLAGVDPSEILAITFTRKGAREVQERLNAWLQDLATHPDDEWVKNFLVERGVNGADALLPQARGLFEKVLAARPGIKINTFHGWFADLVQRAPLQAGVAKGFALTEAVQALEQEAWQRYALSLAESETSLQQAALDDLFRQHGLSNTRKLLANFLAKRAEWWRYTAGQTDPVEFALEQLASQTNVNLGEDHAAALYADVGFDDALTNLVTALEAGGKSQQKLVAELNLVCANVMPGERFSAMMDLIFTQAHTLRAALQKFCIKSGERAAQALAIVSEKMLSAHHNLTEQRMLRSHRSAFTAGHGLLQHYQQLKTERGLFDFTDVEYAAYTLLRHSDYAEYMQYKLDARYRHILLDEFQDTNPLQWMTLQAWLQASSDADLRPTVFLVGDPKQSIFHFRRADARLFRHAAEFLTREYDAIILQQNVSRRSGAAVLDAVNNVFARAKQLSGFTPHRAYDEKLPSAVHLLLLPAVADGGAQSSSPGDGLRDLLALPQLSEADVRRVLEAGELARGIQFMIATWQVQEDGKRRPAEYRDVMILTRSRTQLHRYEFALRAAGIPYVSARQGGLLNSLEAQDLMALLQFLLRPSDDLSLVHALRAPIFDCTDDDLIALAQAPGADWWRRLTAIAATASSALTRAHGYLARWLDRAPHLPVHDLLDRIYFESDLERRYGLAVPQAMAQLVQANLLAFMELSLTLDSGRYPSLSRFLEDLKALQHARDIEAPDEGTLAEVGNAVRILTIHGAKGLEAPIVWIIDATSRPKPTDSYDVLVTWPTGMERPQHFSFLTTKSERGVARETYLAEEASIREQEDANLLYVAMTRAKQYLIVSGNQVGSAAGSWYEALSSAMSQSELARAMSPTSALVDVADQGVVRPTIELPDWYTRPLPYGERKLSTPDRHREYGIKLHALLEAARGGEVSETKAMQLLWNEDEGTRAVLLHHAQAILRAPHLQRFFDARFFLSARNEVALIDSEGELLRVDRIVEFDDNVWILDYKSAASKAARASEFMADYRMQLLRYRHAMANIYPDKSLHCGLIFGDGVLEEIH